MTDEYPPASGGMTRDAPHLFHRVLRATVAMEPLLVLALVPLVWFPRWWNGWPLLAIPMLWAIRWTVNRRPSVRTAYDAPVIALFVLSPLTLLPVFDWSLAAPKLYGLVLGIGLAYALINSLADRRRVLLGVYATVIVVGGGIAAVGLISTEWTAGKWLPLDAIYARLPLLVHGVTRYGTRGAIHPNEIGGALTFLIPLALAAAAGLYGGVGRVRSGRRLALLGAGGLMAVVTLLTVSRSAFIGLAASLPLVLAWWIFGRPRSGRMRVLGGLAFGLAVAAFGGIAWRLVARWASGTEAGLDSFPSRLELWHRALLMLQDFPLTGIGMGQFEPVLHALYVPFLTPPGAYVPHAHQFFLQLGLDLGIPGALAFLMLLLGFFRSLWPIIRRPDDSELQAVGVGLAAGMVGFLVYGLTDAIAVGARGGIVLWVVLGLGMATARRVSSEPLGPDR